MGLSRFLLPLGLVSAMVNCLGCYNDAGILGGPADFEFSDLHSNPGQFSTEPNRDLHQEVDNDINTHCQIVDGATVSPGSGWSDCSEWAYQATSMDCELDCNGGCPDEGSAKYDCQQACYSTCPLEDQGLYRNHIDWEIKHDGDGDDTRTITYDTCVAGFRNIPDTMGCTLGGEQNYGGFWFRIDPNPWDCVSVN